MLVTFEMAKKLKGLKYNIPTRQYYRYDPINIGLSGTKIDHFVDGVRLYNYNKISSQNTFVHTCSAPFVHEAIEWIRDKYNIACGVNVEIFNSSTCEADDLGFNSYSFLWFDKNTKDWGHGTDFEEHPEAELALLEELLTYLERKSDEKIYEKIEKKQTLPS